ncbi:MAG: HEAT repeat domain-containing protein [Vicinamibacterales bacterium]
MTLSTRSRADRIAKGFRHAATHFVALVLLGHATQVPGQELQVGIIDFYGLRQVSESEARGALTVMEGDTIAVDVSAPPPFAKESERRLMALTGVVSARVLVNCCDAGRLVVYVGIEEPGRPALRFRAPPRGNIRLPDDVVQAGEDFVHSFLQAILRGDSGEDHSKGHALANDPATRAVQERFISYAARNMKRLRDVLRRSSDAEHRALAAVVLGYAADKRAIIGDLVYGMSDPEEDVRNYAMRALGVIVQFAEQSPALRIRVPSQPFVDLLTSPSFSDRNKALFALLQLSVSRDAPLIASLRARALESLIEMARWKSEGHAFAAFWLLGRLGGLSEEGIQEAWDRRDREAVIDAALKGP